MAGILEICGSSHHGGALFGPYAESNLSVA